MLSFAPVDTEKVIAALISKASKCPPKVEHYPGDQAKLRSRLGSARPPPMDDVDDSFAHAVLSGAVGSPPSSSKDCFRPSPKASPCFSSSKGNGRRCSPRARLAPLTDATPSLMELDATRASPKGAQAKARARVQEGTVALQARVGLVRAKGSFYIGSHEYAQTQCSDARRESCLNIGQRFHVHIAWRRARVEERPYGYH